MVKVKAKAKQGYTQMTSAIREAISLGLAEGMKQAAIAHQLGYSSCSIGREIARHRAAEAGYRAYRAQARADDAAKRKGRRRKVYDSARWGKTYPKAPTSSIIPRLNWM